MSARKNPHAVALGRKGGKVKSDAKTAAVRANAQLPRRSQRSILREKALAWRRHIAAGEGVQADALCRDVMDALAKPGRARK